MSFKRILRPIGALFLMLVVGMDVWFGFGAMWRIFEGVSVLELRSVF